MFLFLTNAVEPYVPRPSPGGRSYLLFVRKEIFSVYVSWSTLFTLRLRRVACLGTRPAANRVLFFVYVGGGDTVVRLIEVGLRSS